MEFENRAWAEIDLSSIEHNIRAIRKYVASPTKILGVVKADGYGHGYLETARTLLENGADALAVACLDEAIQLRKSGIAHPILILGHNRASEATTLVANDITCTCFDFELAQALSNAATELNQTARIHIKIDTGMGRIGYRYCDNAEESSASVAEILRIAALPNIKIDGIFTHFSVADDSDDEYTFLQFNRFLKICDELKDNGLHIPLRHCCNSAGLVRFPQMHLDMVRPGLIIYGHAPSGYVDISTLGLKPSMTFKARITGIKTLPVGESVSYGRKFIAKEPTKVATVSVGYADGYSRILSGKTQAILGGKLCNNVGNICMDQCMFDVTDVNTIAIGDEVILFGEGDNIELPVESLAEKMGTINYEILCMIGKRIPRIYLKDEKKKASHNYLLDSPVLD